eukprot:m.57508 g.57508  ORF g.57508 m.57508 type:complete len:72 (-) comp12109_c0_seq2:207-422(-)
MLIQTFGRWRRGYALTMPLVHNLTLTLTHTLTHTCSFTFVLFTLFFLCLMRLWWQGRPTLGTKGIKESAIQ